MPNLRLSYFSCIHSHDRALLLQTLAEREFVVVAFDGGSVTNGSSLMEQIGQQLGLDESMRPKSWDGLRDALFEVMISAGGKQVALVWEHADHMSRGDLQDFLESITILHGVAIDTRRARNINSYTLLLGEQPEYRRLDDLLSSE